MRAGCKKAQSIYEVIRLAKVINKKMKTDNACGWHRRGLFRPVLCAYRGIVTMEIKTSTITNLRAELRHCGAVCEKKCWQRKIDKSAAY